MIRRVFCWSPLPAGERMAKPMPSVSAMSGVGEVKRSIPILITTAALLSLSFAGVAQADSQGPITFENYGLGSVNAQFGWSSTGTYDQSVVAQGRFAAFGTQSLRISSAVTSGGFGDQTFSPGLSDPVGEGTTARHFDATFQIGTTQNGVQPGLHLNVSPDNGNGGRMSYLRFDDETDGVHVYFDDVTDASFGTVATFNETDIATLDRTAAHTARFSITVYPGPSNDVVNVYIDGVLKAAGTTWENYYLYDPEQSGGGNQVPVIDKLGLFERGDAVAATAGSGFLVDNLALSSTAATTACEFSVAGSTMTLLDDCITDQTIAVPNGLTLDGKGHSITAVDPAGANFRGAVIQASGPAPTKVTGLTVSASNLADACDAGPAGLRGILFDGVGGIISNNIVTDIEQGANGGSGCQEGNGIEVRNTVGVPMPRLTISSNTVIDYQKTGILVRDNVSAVISDNTVTGDQKIIYIAQNGIQISYGATAQLLRNVVTGNWYTPKSYVACGLILYKAGGVSGAKNGLSSLSSQFTGNENDICNYGKGGSYSPLG